MNKFQEYIVTKALDNSEHLSDWEFDFINDIAEKYGDRDITPAQNKILNRISTKLDWHD